ncbi:MAG: hypothetical protein ACTSU6_07395 [Candidatus Njordarchaeales archaeon]
MENRSESNRHFLELVFSGETKLEKFMALSTIVFLGISLAAIAVWFLMPFYNKYILGMFIPIILFTGTLILRIQLLEEKDRIASKSDIELKKLGLNPQEARKYLTARLENKILKNWLTLCCGSVLLGVLLIIMFPL